MNEDSKTVLALPQSLSNYFNPQLKNVLLPVLKVGSSGNNKTYFTLKKAALHGTRSDYVAKL
jgi:hypothetical protein